MFVLVSVSQVRGHLSLRWYSCTIWADLGPRVFKEPTGPDRWRAHAARSCCHTAGTGSRGAEGDSKNNTPAPMAWSSDCAQDDIFFEWQCNTKLFSIAFTWMLRLANVLQKGHLQEKMLRTASSKIKTNAQNSNKKNRKKSNAIRMFKRQFGRLFDFIFIHTLQNQSESRSLARLVFHSRLICPKQAAQRFTTICINLQMWLSYGLQVVVFAFRSHSFRIVSELFQSSTHLRSKVASTCKSRRGHSATATLEWDRAPNSTQRCYCHSHW